MASIAITSPDTRAWRLPPVLGGYALALLVGFFFLLWSGAWSAGFSGADEPAHFLNNWFVSLYARQALGHNPMAFATEFYLHYPKISIGHWPPAYYALLSPLFLLLPASPQAAMIVNLFVAALPAAGIAWLLVRLGKPGLAPAGALLWALTPLALEGQAFFMLDQPLAACTLAATLAWLRYAERPGWSRILVFAALAALAILVKGNGWLIGLVPALHVLLAGEWRLVRLWKSWVGGAAVAAVVLPWYLLTAGISADGFNYRPGLAYAAQALATNLRALSDNVTPIGLVLAGYAVWSEARGRVATPERWSAVSACLALLLATLILQSAIPADLDPRYAAPALPPVVVLALLGAAQLFRSLPAVSHRFAAPALALLLAAPGLAHVAARDAKADLRLEEAAAIASPAEAWLIDGGSGAEGAYIAARAVRDPHLSGYAVRGSKLLAESDFMGSAYRMRFHDKAAVVDELRRLGLAGIVVVDRAGMEAFPHTLLLRQALADPGSGYRLVATLPHRGRAGTTWIYRADGPVSSDVAAIRSLGIPEKASGLERAGGQS